MAKKKQLPDEVVHSESYVKDFFDMVVPSTVKFNVDHFVCGDSFRCVLLSKKTYIVIKDYKKSSKFQTLC